MLIVNIGSPEPNALTLLLLLLLLLHAFLLLMLLRLAANCHLRYLLSSPGQNDSCKEGGSNAEADAQEPQECLLLGFDWKHLHSLFLHNTQECAWKSQLDRD